MLVSRKWLEEFVDISGISDEDIAAALTNSGTETSVSERLPRIEKVVAASVKSVEPADKRLSILKLDVGREVQIVSNLPYDHLLSLRGKKVAVVLEGGRVGDALIKEKKFGDFVSHGALVPASYLFLGEENEVAVLPDSLEDGEDLVELLDLNDVLLEVEITPNRGDLLSHFGIARELAAVLKRELKFQYRDYLGRARFEKTDFVKIVEEEGCTRYSGALIKSGSVFRTALSGRKGLLVVSRLRRVGYRDINNWVDVTNYILVGYGQPMHVFDLSKIKGKIIVRLSKEGEHFTALDGTSLTLPEGVMVIADDEVPLAVAGVMGGLESGVVDDTLSFFFESAHFNPSFVRMSERLTPLSSESSYRFSRGTDPAMPPVALLLAWELISELHEEYGKDLSVPIFSDNKSSAFRDTAVVSFPSKDYVSEVLGKEVPYGKVKEILENLGFSVSGLKVKVPSWRFYDVSRKEDLLEEVGRIDGYNDVPDVLPEFEVSPHLPAVYTALSRLRFMLSSRGMNEFITYSFVSEKLEKSFGFGGSIPEIFSSSSAFENSRTRKFSYPVGRVFIKNPLSEESVVMRTSVLSSMVPAVVSNILKGNRNVMAYEMGRVFIGNDSSETGAAEPLRLAFAMTGDFLEDHWRWGKIEADFYMLRSVVEDSLGLLMRELGLSSGEDHRVKVEPFYAQKDAEFPFLKELPGVKFVIEGPQNSCVAGFASAVQPEVLKDVFGEVFPLYVAEVEIDSIMPLWMSSSKSTISYRKFPRFPEPSRDIAVLLPRESSFAVVSSVMEKFDFVSRYSVFDYYTGSGIEEGYVSLGIRIWFKPSFESQYTDEELNFRMEGIKKALSEAGIKFRNQ